MQQKISKIIKRDERKVDFDQEKITNAIFKASQSVGGKDRNLAQQLSDKVVAQLEKLGKVTPSVEEIQDIVEKVLIEEGQAATAKAYILYRQERAAVRKEKQLVLEKEEIDEVDKRFDVNALRVLKARYLRKDVTGKLIETPKQLFTRVAVHSALPDLMYDARIFDINGQQPVNETENFNPAAHDERSSIGNYKLNKYHLEALRKMYDRFNRNKQMKVTWSKFFDMIKKGEFSNYEKSIEEFYNLMTYKLFMPNTPAIANFGNPLGMGSACFALDVPDSIEGIMETLKSTAIVFKAGGGMGYNFSKLRPEGDFVSSTGGTASGPISFMRLFDTMTEVIKQGGIRRGANMGILNSNHPDIEKFITAKEGNKALRNFNISVLMMPDFWEHYKNNTPYPLVNPKDRNVVRHISPKVLFDKMVYQAWESAEPGVIFFDRVNDYNPFYEHLGPIVTTNPCIAGDTLISTENGLERIDSIKTKNIVVDVRTETTGNNLLTLQKGCKLVEAMQIVKTGIKDAYRFTTKSGYELIATADHKVLTDNGWKEVCKLTENDSVLLQSGKGNFNKNYDLNRIVQIDRLEDYNSQTFLSLPRRWSRELGIILGLWCGDGYISTNGRRNKSERLSISIGRNEYDIVEYIMSILCKWVKVSITKPVNNQISIRTANSGFIRLIKSLGVTSDLSHNKRVPKSIFTAPEEAVIGFLQGMFTADGSVRNNFEKHDFMIRLDSSSLQLLKDVQLLLSNLGIKSSIYTSERGIGTIRGKTIKNITFKHELRITKENRVKFKEMIGFLSAKKNQALRNQPDVDLSNHSNHSIEYFTDNVLTIEYVGKREVYDITEPLTHSFIANGIVVHNCGEVLLYPNEPCNLGSINVWAFAKQDEQGNASFDWDSLREVTISCTRFLDNVIDVNNFPLKAIEEMSLATRKIGLGVMGVADLLYEMRLPYNTEEGRKFMEQLMEFVNYWSKVESIELAKKRGILPYYDKSFYKKGGLPFRGSDSRNEWHFDWEKIAEDIKKHGIRNGYTTVIAPTGSISMIAGCSSGIEPVYSIVFEKNVKVGSFYYVDPAAEKVLMEEGVYSDKLMEDLNEHKGSIQKIGYIAENLRKVLVTAMDITPEEHIRALASFQKWVDSSISKTINFPANATIEDMRESYILAYKLGCKDVTVFRDTSIKDQVLVAPKAKEEKEEIKMELKKMEAKPEQKKTAKYPLTNCPECGTKLEIKEGCLHCSCCGWGLCM